MSKSLLNNLLQKQGDGERVIYSNTTDKNLKWNSHALFKNVQYKSSKSYNTKKEADNDAADQILKFINRTAESKKKNIETYKIYIIDGSEFDSRNIISKNFCLEDVYFVYAYIDKDLPVSNNIIPLMAKVPDTKFLIDILKTVMIKQREGKTPSQIIKFLSGDIPEIRMLVDCINDVGFETQVQVLSK